MSDFDYVVVGAGMAGAAAVRGIRSEDATGTIALVGSEPDPPYNRTALSKALWRDPSTTLGSIELGGPDLPGVTSMYGTWVTEVDAVEHRVLTSDGQTLGYRRLVLATGGRARTGGIAPGPRIIHFHALPDYRTLRVLSREGAHVIVVGGGFIGTELAAVLAETPATVTFVFPGAHVDGHVLPEEFARHLDEVYAAHGVELVPNSRVRRARMTDLGYGAEVVLEDGRRIRADAVVLGLGQEPCTELASSVTAGLSVHRGIVVDAHRRTSDPDIFAAGDAVEAPDRVFGMRRVQHEDAAVRGGLTAGRNAAGGDVVDDHVPFFYSDLFEDGYEALGDTDPRLRTLVDHKGSNEAVIYYLDADSVLQGVLMWNVWGEEGHDTKAIAADLLAQRSPRADRDLLGRI